MRKKAMSDTDRERLARLVESEQKYRRMIASAFDAIFSIDIESGRILEVNPKGEELTGYTAGELASMSVWDLHPENEVATAKELFSRVADSGKGLRSALHILKRDGTLVDIDVSASVVEYGGRKVIQRICRDVTEQRQLERHNEYLRQYYESILDMMPIGLGVKTNPGPDAEIEFENKKLKAIFSTQQAQRERCCWTDSALDKQYPTKTILNDDGAYAEEREYPNRHVYMFTSSYFRDIEDTWRELQVVQDVTARRKLEDALTAANEELEDKVAERTRELQAKQTQLVQSEKMAALGNLVAGVAHEINTPLGALVSNNDLFFRTIVKLKELFPNSQSTELAEHLERIDKINRINKEAADRIVTIVKSLRDFARLDQAEKDTVDIRKGLDSTLTLVQHELKGRVEIVREYGPVPNLTCFPNQLNQVFMNLLVNASQAIEGKGKITVRTFEKDGALVVEIADTGKGMSEDTIRRAFDPGFTTKGSGIGTGLGLSIVHQIIEGHGGKVEIDSRLGQGTTFRLILPLERSKRSQ